MKFHVLSVCFTEGFRTWGYPPIQRLKCKDLEEAMIHCMNYDYRPNKHEDGSDESEGSNTA